ncbi:hypothetical protein HMPREF9440_00558 [Sutterella parvirubra YIT 11816]|uniref:Uncharacterized protein n=1 Tax=Sutterella parvirubra YIT 11816 TaxID=762967 RepID=H3KCV4_9BURK|nr:hypothetical protein HMPREF9440_00558 [Sutterella parvirubra YIT 11816]
MWGGRVEGSPAPRRAGRDRRRSCVSGVARGRGRRRESGDFKEKAPTGADLL